MAFFPQVDMMVTMGMAEIMAMITLSTYLFWYVVIHI
jgi:hypothetical protein